MLRLRRDRIMGVQLKPYKWHNAHSKAKVQAKCVALKVCVGDDAQLLQQPILAQYL